eukprot:gnl/Spiro4/8975_TR4736_c0_g1_i1.p1 gnl/Spiro4/8975_TR4736_c0_g1~~gnl/Spiro4/8975_TR4736_c0_g1_i1.p1  ORF type:complete len:149 (+),score=30.44 gnl/Spiro4/8975_TR4736_c0_g1_i1:156-602(+)
MLPPARATAATAATAASPLHSSVTLSLTYLLILYIIYTNLLDSDVISFGLRVSSLLFVNQTTNSHASVPLWWLYGVLTLFSLLPMVSHATALHRPVFQCFAGTESGLIGNGVAQLLVIDVVVVVLQLLLIQSRLGKIAVSPAVEIGGV